MAGRQRQALMKMRYTKIILSVLTLALGCACTDNYSVLGFGESCPGGLPFSHLTCPGYALWATTGNMNISSTGIVVDAYSSTLGAYGGPNVSSAGNLRAGGHIHVSGSPTSLSGTVTQNSPVNLEYTKTGSSSLGSLALSSAGTTLTFTAGDYFYDSINISGSNWTLSAPGGQVRIWYNSLMISGSNVTLGTTVPNDLWLLGTCQGSVNASGPTSTICAVIYTPSGGLNFSGANLTFYGSIVGKVINVNGSNQNFHRDLAVCGY